VQGSTYADDDPDSPTEVTAPTLHDGSRAPAGGSSGGERGGGGDDPSDPGKPTSNSKMDKPEVRHGTDVRLLFAGIGSRFIRMRTYQKVSSTANMKCSDGTIKCMYLLSVLPRTQPKARFMHIPQQLHQS
jgi:hypothetical protein